METALEKNKQPSNLSKNLMWVTYANILARILFFVSSIVVARYLFPKDFGIISLAITFYSLIDSSSSFGMDSFLIYHRDSSKKQINSIFFLNILIAGIFSFLIIALSSVIAKSCQTPEVKIILIISGITFFINRFGGNYKALLIKELKQDVVAKIEIITNILNSVLIIVFAMLGFKYLSYIIPALISQILMTCIYIFKIKWSFSSEFNFKTMKEALIYSKSFMPQSLLLFFLDKADYMIVGYILGSTALGYYYFGYEKAVLLIIMITSIIQTTFFPVFSKFQNNFSELKQFYNSLILKLSYYIYPVIFGLILLAPEFLHLIFGSRWDNSVFTFRFILAYAFLKLISNTIIIVFNAIGRPDQNLKHYLISAPFFIILFFLSTKYGGLKGISFMAFAVQSLASLLLIIRLCKFFKWRLFEVLNAPLRILCLLIIQAIILIPLKLSLYKLNLPVIVVFIAIIILSILIYYLQTQIFLKNIKDDLLNPLIKKLHVLKSKLFSGGIKTINE